MLRVEVTYWCRPLIFGCCLLIVGCCHLSMVAAFRCCLWSLTGQWCMQIIDRIVEHHLHRVYVVNDCSQAVGVVTLTDLLRRVTEEARKA